MTVAIVGAGVLALPYAVEQVSARQCQQTCFRDVEGDGKGYVAQRLCCFA